MSAVFRSFVLAPDGNSIATYQETIALSESEPLIMTHGAPFMTTQAGIHRLLYQIYIQGQAQQEEIILSAGSKAFEVGDAIITGLLTDKSDYPTDMEPVNAMVNLFGYGSVSINFYIDEQPSVMEQLTLNGSETKTFLIANSVSAGTHKVRAVLRTGMLESSREATFRYGTGLADLIIS